MHTFLDAKTMAKALRQGLAERRIELGHSDCLELVARQFGLNDWNTLAARIEAATADDVLPDGWNRAGPGDAGHHRISLDASEPGAVRIESLAGIHVHESIFSTLAQRVHADAYRGHKLRLTAELRGEGAHLGTIWMRIDPADGKYLRFDNMMFRKANGALRGTFGWTERSIVLDVPEAAASIHFGFFLKGEGKLWARRFRLEVAEPDAGVTGDDPFLPQPTNLDFTRPAQA